MYNNKKEEIECSKLYSAKILSSQPYLLFLSRIILTLSWMILTQKYTRLYLEKEPRKQCQLFEINETIPENNKTKYQAVV